jgi:tetratricopeptide (TPR) repeat protein
MDEREQFFLEPEGIHQTRILSLLLSLIRQEPGFQPAISELALTSMSWLSQAHGDLSFAIDCLNEANALVAHSDLLDVCLGFAYQRSKHYDRALGIWTSMAERMPTNAMVAFNVACQHYALKDLSQAEIWFARAIELAPDEFESYDRLALIYLSTGREQLGYELFSKAVAHGSNRVMHYRFLTMQYELLGQYQQLTQTYRLAIERQALDYELLCDYGEHCQRNSDYSQALDCYYKALVFSPENAFAYLEIGRCHYLLGDYSRAKEYIKRAQQIEPKADFKSQCERLLMQIESKFNIANTDKDINDVSKADHLSLWEKLKTRWRTR